MSRFWQVLATLGPIGYLPIAPGTWGSAVAAVLWWFIGTSSSVYFQIALIILLIPFAIWSADKAEKNLGHDAKPIVIDEVAGQWITLLFAPKLLHFYIVGFFLFRAFDVLKPFPVHQSQRLPGGFGIVIDDVLAGLYAGVTLLIIRRVFFG